MTLHVVPQAGAINRLVDLENNLGVLSESQKCDLLPMKRMNTNVLIEEWELWQHSARLDQAMIRDRVSLLTRLERETSTNPAYSTAVQLARWLADHREQWKRATQCTYFSYLSAWFKWLQRQEYRTDNPMLKLQAPKAPKRVANPVADEHLMRILKTNMHHRTRVMVLLGALTGARVSEIAAIRGEDVDLDRMQPTITIREGKNEKTRIVPLHPILIETARRMPRRGWWFPSDVLHPGEHVRGKSVSQIISNLFRRADVPKTPHGLRHWFGTTLLDDGANLRVVQELMGHASVATTQIYTLVPEKHLHMAVAKLDLMRALNARPDEAEPTESAAPTAA